MIWMVQGTILGIQGRRTKECQSVTARPMGTQLDDHCELGRCFVPCYWCPYSRNYRTSATFTFNSLTYNGHIQVVGYISNLAERMNESWNLSHAQPLLEGRDSFCYFSQIHCLLIVKPSAPGVHLPRENALSNPCQCNKWWSNGLFLIPLWIIFTFMFLKLKVKFRNANYQTVPWNYSIKNPWRRHNNLGFNRCSSWF